MGTNDSQCRRCGERLPQGAVECPHCGASREKKLPLPLIGAFFIIGVLLGLLFVDSELYHDLREQWGAPAAAQAPPSTDAQSDRGRRESQQERAARQENASKQVLAPAGSDASEMLVCNPEVAQKILAKAGEIAVIQQVDGILNVRLRQQWAYYTPGIRRSFLEAFAESDACIEGGTRPIHFYYGGEKIAVSEPPQGLRGEE